MHSTTPQAQPTRRSWWSRNWKWFLPLVVIAPVFTCLGVVTLLVSLVFGLLKGSEPFEYSLATVQADPRVQAELGTPIESAFLVSGSINLSGSSGDADLSYDVSGPNGSATVYVVATKSAGVWQYSDLVADVHATGTRIDLQTTP
ncbi:MAG: cytochrome c oxidase assembly factor Coa1 family protein [Planctomycetota bacterium]